MYNEYFDTKDERNDSNDLMNSTYRVRCRHSGDTVYREVENKLGIEKSTTEVEEDTSRLRPNNNEINFNLNRFRYLIY